MPETSARLERAGFPAWLAAMLARRGVASGGEAEAFLSPSVEQLRDPSELEGVGPAVSLLLEARRAGRRVAVVGDYDVDGVSGTALLTAVLRSRGLDTVPILPHRIHDGYGFREVHVERAREQACGLVITVDCGTTSHGAVGAALGLGMGVIVTDHHLPGEPLPGGTIVINPKQSGEGSPFAELSGAGLAFELALAFAAASGRPLDPGRLARIACLGTIADMVPLRGQNRIIAAVGLRELADTRSPGLRALVRVARIRPPFAADDVGFRLGPRLNAPGRLASAEPALELLLTRDEDRARQLAADLDARNRERQEWERQAAEEAREQFLARDPLPAFPVAWSPDWHRGVVGIAAGRLARELHRPVVLFSQDGDSATGSGRSIPSVHLFDFLAPWAGRLERFGGHAQAVGLTAPVGELEALALEWNRVAEGAWAKEIAVRRLEYEAAVRPAEVGQGMLEQLRRLAPFGQGNPRPLLRVVGPLRLVRPPRRFGRGHLEAELAGEDRGRIPAVGWGWESRAHELEGPIEVLGYLDLDRYRGAPVLRLEDCRPSPS